MLHSCSDEKLGGGLGTRLVEQGIKVTNAHHIDCLQRTQILLAVHLHSLRLRSIGLFGPLPPIQPLSQYGCMDTCKNSGPLAPVYNQVEYQVEIGTCHFKYLYQQHTNKYEYTYRQAGSHMMAWAVWVDPAFSLSSASLIQSSRLISTRLACNEDTARSIIFGTMWKFS